MYIYVKNMVCVRCKMIVRTVLDKLAIPYREVELGRVSMAAEISIEQKTLLNDALMVYELELMDNSRKILVERIKVAIVEMFHSDDSDNLLKLSEYLSRALNYDYTYLANTFSELEKGTIEKFYILKKVERVRELMIYDEMSLKEISYKLNYSSISHLCKQFKTVTGLTPAKFKKSWNQEQPMK